MTLRRQEGKEDVLLRADIEEMAASGQSLMPEGLEKDLTPRDMADLIAFLEGDRTAPEERRGQSPADGPAGARRDDRPAAPRTPRSTARRLVFEPQLRQPRLLVVRQRSRRLAFEVAAARQVRRLARLGLRHRDAAGNVLELNLGGQQIRYQVAGTGTWDDYAMKRDRRAGARRGHPPARGPARRRPEERAARPPADRAPPAAKPAPGSASSSAGDPPGDAGRSADATATPGSSEPR